MSRWIEPLNWLIESRIWA